MPGYEQPFKYLETTPHRRQIFSADQHKLIPFDTALPQSKQERENVNKNGNLISLPISEQVPALMLSQMRFFNEFPIPAYTRLMLANMAFYPGFDVTRFSNLRTKAAEIRPTTILASNGDNLGTVLHEIITRYDFHSVADDIRGFLKAAYSSFEEIHCDTTFGTPPQVLVRVREKGMQRSMELWELSDGMVRFLCLASALLNPIPPPIIMIDEPEIGLHPKLMPIIADMIKTAAERTQVLVTTHCPDLLNMFDLTDIAVMSRSSDKAKASWHRPADRKSLVQMLNAVTGVTLSDLQRSGELEEAE
jgi:predicted ATPase